MNLQHERIAGLCAQLKLDCIATDWAPLAQRTATTDSSMADFLEQLLQAELGAREQRKRQVLTKLAALPGVKTLEQYDFSFASGAPRAQIQELAWIPDTSGRMDPVQQVNLYLLQWPAVSNSCRL